MKKAVVLLSGGIDSVTTVAIAQQEGYAVYALSVHYGQRHGIEIEKARRSAAAMGVAQHLVLTIDLASIGGSALTASIPVPKDRYDASGAHEIPITYVPARNTIFLSCALAWAEVLQAYDIFIGVHAQDYSGYPDCRPEYLRAFERLANLATKTAVEGRGSMRIHAPLLNLGKADIIRRGIALGVDYSLTHSCYDPFPNGAACGRCDSCRFRRKGFAEAGLTDPIVYQNP